MRKGIYERLVREGEEAEVSRLETEGRAWVDAVPEGLRRDLLLDDVAARIPELLDVIASSSADQAERARQELELIAGMLRAARGPVLAGAGISPPSTNLRLLRAVHEPRIRPTLPRTGLRHPWLFTSGKNEPSLYTELRAELETAGQLDILVSFIKKAGVRKLADVFERVTAVDAQGIPKLQVRILTTTYMGATDRAALDQLGSFPGVEIRISLDGRRERLHAKAWIFHRANSFGTAFVGSANLSKSALIDGIEWTLKIAQARDAALFDSARANFETLWNDPEFAHYNPHDEAHRQMLDQALSAQRASEAVGVVAIKTWFDLQPKPFQQIMLDRLAYERARGRTRNLLVAATGTGKTVVSAFDYRRLCAQIGGRPRLMFIAHQRQILQQAQETFRQVLRDPGFGEILDGNSQPASYAHLFAMVQTLTSRGLVEALGADYWTMVIVDEAHHLPAAGFRAVVERLKPAVLLGLTATPERLDGESLLVFFDARPDGSPTYSLRIWDALDQQLLCPFEYYATADEVDFRGVDWGKGQDLGQSAQILTGNDMRARSVSTSIERYVDDVAGMKALAFCTSVEHARSMAGIFDRMGLPAVAVSGSDAQSIREGAVTDLQAGKIKIICTVNLFNEGIDIPAVNTLFLLRPTQSPVVFQQQIGRGLRLHPGKSCCLILDYVGLYGQEFRFDLLYRGFTGLSRRQLESSVENGFGFLPPGCHIQLDKVSRERVLDNLRRSLQINARRLRAEILAWAASREGELHLADFLRDQGIELEELYANGRSWQGLLREVGLPSAIVGPEDANLLRRVGRLIHVDDPELLRTWRDWLDDVEDAGRAPLMLLCQLFHEQTRFENFAGFRQALRKNPALAAELGELLTGLLERTENSGHPMRGAPSEWPLALHARYGRRELLAALGYWTEAQRPTQREGVLVLNDRVMGLFVTLDKRAGFHQGVRYKDYAISPDLFAWETQNRANPGNTLGRNFIDSPENGWRFFLFVREDQAHGFVAMGEVVLERWESCEKGPIPIVWRLVEPMTAELFRRFSVLRQS